MKKMKFRKQYYSLGIALCLFPLLTEAKPLPNLDAVKKEMVQYHDSGQYAADIHKTTQQALDYIRHRVAENNKAANPKKLAAVFDIDETSLSNYPAMLKMGFGGTPKAINDAEDLANDPPILDILKVYNFAKENGVTVFFITGRKEFQRHATTANLRSAGYQGWQALFMKPNDYNLPSVIPYKSGARKKIVEMGYDIILNIGDQWSDLKGGFADKTFKIVDPYYYIP
jgi:predicted secreted acid phosphatase